MGSRLAHQFFEKRYIYETQGGRILIRLLVILKKFYERVAHFGLTYRL